MHTNINRCAFTCDYKQPWDVPVLCQLYLWGSEKWRYPPGFLKMTFSHEEEVKVTYCTEEKMSQYFRMAVGVGISSLCCSSILHNSSTAHVKLMGPIKKEKDWFSDGMWYHEESAPRDSTLFTFLNTPHSASPDETIYNSMTILSSTKHVSILKQTYKQLLRSPYLFHFACQRVCNIPAHTGLEYWNSL